MRVRAYKLAQALSIDPKDFLDLCREIGIDAKNQLTSIALDTDNLELLAASLKMTPETLKELCRPIDIDQNFPPCPPPPTITIPRPPPPPVPPRSPPVAGLLPRRSTQRPGGAPRTPRAGEEHLIHEIEQCLLKGTPAAVNLSVPRHKAITRALHKFAYDPAFARKELPVVFKDGSHPSPFPVGCLTKSDQYEAPAGRIIYAGLMSMRHPELDYLVDFYVTRNQELAKEASMADEEQLAFDRTIALLDVQELDEGAEVGVLHTGLEPMVVGFYRAVVDILRRREKRKLKRNLIIRSMFYREPKPESRLRSDSRKHLNSRSPGALLDNYRGSLLWC